MSAIKRWIHLFWIPLASLSVAVTLTILISPMVYQMYTASSDIHLSVGLTPLQLNTDYKVLFAYFLNPFQKTLQFNYFSSSANGLQHFREVKNLMLLNAGLSLVSIGMILSFVLRKKPKWYRLQLKGMIGWLIYLPLALLFSLLIAFDQAFVLFHQLFFRNDLWLFNPLTDPIIYVLPQSLFLILFVIAICIYELIVIMIKNLL